MATKPYNIAVVGYGLSAKVFHIPLLAVVPELTLYAIVQRSPTPENDAKNDHPSIKHYRSTEEMVTDPDVDVVIVTAGPHTHFQICELALDHGKHVVVEKPFVPTSKEATRLIELAMRKQRFLTVYQNRRWDTDFLTLSELVKQGKMGRLVEFETRFDRHRPKPPADTGWKNRPLPGGGALYNLGTHLLDQICVLFGTPDSVTAFVGTQRETTYVEGLDDAFTVMLHYPARGLLVTAKAGIINPEVEDLRFWVRGEKGSYKKSFLDVQEGQLRSGLKPGDPGFAAEPQEQAGTLTVMEDGMLRKETYPNVQPLTYRAFYDHFAKALAGHGDVPVKAEEARVVIRLIELAKRSSKEGRTISVQACAPSIDD